MLVFLLYCFLSKSQSVSKARGMSFPNGSSFLRELSKNGDEIAGLKATDEGKISMALAQG